MMIFFGVIGVLALGFGIGVVIMSIAEADSSLTFAGLGLVFGGGLLLIGSLAAGNAIRSMNPMVRTPRRARTRSNL
jgi:hypothetical protein